jgi:CysZ protein
LFKDIIISIRSFFQAHRFIKQHKLFKWVLLPGIIYTLLFMVSMYFFSTTANTFIKWMSVTTGLKNWIDTLHNSFIGFIFTVTSLFLWLLQMLLYFSLFKYIFLIIGSPIFAFLGEKTEAIIEGKTYPFSLSLLFKNILRSIKLALRNSVWQTVYMLSLLILSFIPIIGWITPLLAILIECYFYGFSMLDYGQERQNKTASQSIFFISNHKGLAIGNGIVFYIMHLVPIIGWIFAPSYAAIAATLSMIDLQKKDTL